MLERSFYLFNSHKVVFLVFSRQILGSHDNAISALAHGLDYLVLLVNLKFIAAHDPAVLTLAVSGRARSHQLDVCTARVNICVSSVYHRFLLYL